MPAFPPLLPAPRAVRATGATVDLRARSAIRVPRPWLDGPLARRLNDLLPEFAALPGGDATAVNPPGEAPALIDLREDPRLGPEAFVLTVREPGCRLAAGGPAGAWYGLRALLQLLQQGGGVAPVCEIEDAPGFPARGVMLDISRCKVPTMETLRFLVARLARLRINQLQLYTEHTFAYAGHGQVWRDASPVTAAEIRELDACCAEHFIELVPNQNSFGHFERWLRHPEYKCFAESPGGFTSPWGTVFPHGSVLRPDEESLRLLDDLHDQLLPNFTSRRFNVGCDETYELGEGWSREQCAARGRHRVYLDFLLALHRRVAARGFQMQFWGDIILKQPDLIRELPPASPRWSGATSTTTPSPRSARNSAPPASRSTSAPAPVPGIPLLARTPTPSTTSAPPHGGRDAGACGFLVTDWGDNGHHQPLPVSFLPFAAGACLAWNPDGLTDDEAESAAGRAFFDGMTSEAARLFGALGRVSDVIRERFYNSTLFHHALFHSDPVPEKLAERFSRVPAEELRAADGLLQVLAGSAGGFGGRPPARRVPPRHRHGPRRHRPPPVAHGAGVDPPDFPQTLAGLRESHRAVWLARNRPGGLAESLGKLGGAVDAKG
ncbi:MAG: glycoside hydrolase family 20 zincin-like fold domain-containing protein [Kiritimatiellia bacterium]